MNIHTTQMDIEKILESGCPKESPFKVPEGYFDSLNERIMNRVDEAGTAKVVRFRPQRIVRWAAACIVAVAICSVTFSHIAGGADSTEIQANVEYDDDLQEAMDYAMIDNHDVYFMIAGE